MANRWCYACVAGCKIKDLRAKTNTYIKTPVRGEEPVFVVTGRREDVKRAEEEIRKQSDHFSEIRANRHLERTQNSSHEHTRRVLVPYKLVGLVVGPKGATIKKIQEETGAYIITPNRHAEPCSRCAASRTRWTRRPARSCSTSRTGPT